MTKPKTSEERKLLQLQSRELTLRSNIINKQDEHQAVKAEIASTRAKLVKAKK